MTVETLKVYDLNMLGFYWDLQLDTTVRPGLLRNWGSKSRCWKFPVDTVMLFEKIVSDTKWRLALHWVAVTERERERE